MSTERKLLLSDDSAITLICGVDESPWRVIRAFYEAKLASGELRVCKPVKAVYGDHGGIMGWSCTECSAPCDPKYYGWCPGCGNPISE